MVKMFISIAPLLLLRWERAKRTLQIAEESFHQLMPPEDGKNHYETAELWLLEEKTCYTSTRFDKNGELPITYLCSYNYYM